MLIILTSSAVQYHAWLLLYGWWFPFLQYDKAKWIWTQVNYNPDSFTLAKTPYAQKKCGWFCCGCCCFSSVNSLVETFDCQGIHLVFAYSILLLHMTKDSDTIPQRSD